MDVHEGITPGKHPIVVEPSWRLREGYHSCREEIKGRYQLFKGPQVLSSSSPGIG